LADAHAFLHKRVTLYVKILLGFFAVFLVFAVLKYLFVHAGGKEDWLRSTHISNLLLLFVTLDLAGSWLYLRARQRSVRMLHWIESVGTVLWTGVMAWTLGVLPPDLMFPVEFGLLMVVVLSLVIRAAVVPSSARRTLVVGLVATAALAGPMWYRGTTIDPALNPYWRFIPVAGAPWGIVFAIATAIVSRVIYGLQERVREAMQLGNYTLEKKLGEGGMGIVYQARHAMLRRPTAVKLLPPEKSGERTVVRFEREVQLTARLTHPNTVTVFDFGRTPQGVFYYAMELLDGASLEDVVAVSAAQPAARVIHILHQVAGALSEAHGIGLIHRDIKPANIILCEQGGEPDVPKVVDFGLVKEMSPGDSVALTKAEFITGTPLYMSPEAITKPDGMDARSDLYALGAVGYYLLTGDHVFVAATAVEVCSHHLHTTPQPPSKRLGAPVPEDLEGILMRCLEKSPSSRPGSAAALQRDLRRCREFGDWDAERARRWWGENADRLRARRAAMRGDAIPAAGVPEPGTLLSVDAMARR